MCVHAVLDAVRHDNQHRQTADRANGQTDKEGNGQREEQDTSPLDVLVSRLEEAGLSTDRFIRLNEGRKQAYDHTEWRPEIVTGNYGVYCGDGLIGVDIDDRAAWDDASGTEDLPVTFAVLTAHDGRHHYYRAPEDLPGILSAVTGGSKNPSLSWGEIHVTKYLVGPGSELLDCDNSDCNDCDPGSPGRYEIIADRPIAQVSEDAITALVATGSDGRQGSIAEFGADVSSFEDPDSVVACEETCPEPWSFQRQVCRQSSGPLDEAETVVLDGLTDHACGRPDEGIQLDTIVDWGTANGLSVHRVAAVVRHWLDMGHLRRGDDPNRVIPRQRDS